VLTDAPLVSLLAVLIMYCARHAVLQMERLNREAVPRELSHLPVFGLDSAEILRDGLLSAADLSTKNVNTQQKVGGAAGAGAGGRRRRRKCWWLCVVCARRASHIALHQTRIILTRHAPRLRLVRLDDALAGRRPPSSARAVRPCRAGLQ
jgi:hypothetical protein